MSYSTLSNVNYSGLPDSNYSGTSIGQYNISVTPMLPNIAYVSGTSNVLRMGGHSPNPDPWAFFYVPRTDYHYDVTLNISNAQLYDGQQTIDVFLRAQDPTAAAITGGGGYEIIISPTNSTITWYKMYPFLFSASVKSISHSFSFPCKLRLTFEGQTLSVYIDDVFIDSYDYTAYDAANPGYTYGAGYLGLRQYGVWNIDLNQITYKGDRLDNFTIA
jgi:hypothetical protein